MLFFSLFAASERDGKEEELARRPTTTLSSIGSSVFLMQSLPSLVAKTASRLPMPGPAPETLAFRTRFAREQERTSVCSSRAGPKRANEEEKKNEKSEVAFRLPPLFNLPLASPLPPPRPRRSARFFSPSEALGGTMAGEWLPPRRVSSGGSSSSKASGLERGKEGGRGRGTRGEEVFFLSLFFPHSQIERVENACSAFRIRSLQRTSPKTSSIAREKTKHKKLIARRRKRHQSPLLLGSSSLARAPPPPPHPAAPPQRPPPRPPSPRARPASARRTTAPRRSAGTGARRAAPTSRSSRRPK